MAVRLLMLWLMLGVGAHAADDEGKCAAVRSYKLSYFLCLERFDEAPGCLGLRDLPRRQLCYALDTHDRTKCLKLQGEDRIICDAVARGEYNRCSPVVDPLMRGWCEALARQDRQYCSRIGDLDLMRECKRVFNSPVPSAVVAAPETRREALAATLADRSATGHARRRALWAGLRSSLLTSEQRLAEVVYEVAVALGQEDDLVTFRPALTIEHQVVDANLRSLAEFRAEIGGGLGYDHSWIGSLDAVRGSLERLLSATADLSRRLDQPDSEDLWFLIDQLEHTRVNVVGQLPTGWPDAPGGHASAATSRPRLDLARARAGGLESASGQWAGVDPASPVKRRWTAQEARLSYLGDRTATLSDALRATLVAPIDARDVPEFVDSVLEVHNLAADAELQERQFARSFTDHFGRSAHWSGALERRNHAISMLAMRLYDAKSAISMGRRLKARDLDSWDPWLIVLAEARPEWPEG